MKKLFFILLAVAIALPAFATTHGRIPGDEKPFSFSSLWSLIWNQNPTVSRK